MKRIFIAAFLFFGTAAYAQAPIAHSNRPASQNYGWQQDRDEDDDDDDDSRYHRQGYNRNHADYKHWNKKQKHQKGYRAGYVRNHPAYRNILAARIPLREGRQVEAQLRRIEQMEMRFAHNGRMSFRERALIDRELMRLDAYVARYGQRGYAWR